MRNKYSKAIFLTTAIVLSLLLSAFEANAQTSKRRRQVRRTVPVVVQPIQPVAAGNAPYVDGNQIVLGEIPSNQTNENPTGANNSFPAAPVSSEDKETQIRQLNDRIKTLESAGAKEAKQKQLLLNLDIMSRAESRAESLRKQLFDIIEKENTTQARIEQINLDARGENIERIVALSGSLRPEDLRDQRRKSLESEKNNLGTLLTQIQTNRISLEASVQRADALVEKVRAKLDKEIDDSLADDGQNQ